MHRSAGKVPLASWTLRTEEYHTDMHKSPLLVGRAIDPRLAPKLYDNLDALLQTHLLQTWMYLMR